MFDENTSTEDITTDEKKSTERRIINAESS